MKKKIIWSVAIGWMRGVVMFLPVVIVAYFVGRRIGGDEGRLWQAGIMVAGFAYSSSLFVLEIWPMIRHERALTAGLERWRADAYELLDIVKSLKNVATKAQDIAETQHALLGFAINAREDTQEQVAIALQRADAAIRGWEDNAALTKQAITLVEDSMNMISTSPVLMQSTSDPQRVRQSEPSLEQRLMELEARLEARLQAFEQSHNQSRGKRGRPRGTLSSGSLPPGTTVDDILPFLRKAKRALEAKDGSFTRLCEQYHHDESTARDWLTRYSDLLDLN